MSALEKVSGVSDPIYFFLFAFFKKTLYLCNMEDLKFLISQNRLEDVCTILLQDANVKNEVILLQGRLTQHKRAFNAGLLSHSEDEIGLSKIRCALMEICESFSSNTAPTTTTTPTMIAANPLKQFNTLYRDSIHADLDSLNFVESNVRNYVTQLGTIFSNPALFNAFLQPLNDAAYNDVNASLADKRQVLKGILQNLVAKEQNLRTRLEGQVQKVNSEVDFVERLNQFFTNPTPIGWKNVYETVGRRFSDHSLFGKNVSIAWDEWDAKLSKLDMIDIAFDLAQGQQMRNDLGAFLAANLAIKNFNYQ